MAHWLRICVQDDLLMLVAVWLAPLSLTLMALALLTQPIRPACPIAQVPTLLSVQRPMSAPSLSGVVTVAPSVATNVQFVSASPPIDLFA